MPRVVLDASAVLAFLQGEPGADAVDEVLAESMVSAVNIAEVATKLSDFGMPDDQIFATVNDMRLDIISFDEQAAYASAALRSATRAKGLSLGDRACLALAKAEDAPALTADRVWRKIDVGVEIRSIRT